MSSGSIKRKNLLPEGIVAALGELRLRTRRTKVLEALLAALFGFLICYWLLFTVDRFYDTPTWARWIVFVLGSMGGAVYLPYMVKRWVWGTTSPESVAKLLRFQSAALSDEVLSVVELAHNSLEQSRSPRLIDAAMGRVEEQVSKFDVARSVPYPRVKQWGLLAAPWLVVVVVCAITVPKLAMNSWARYLFPWAEIDRFTFARLNNPPKELIVPFSEPFSVQLALATNSDWKPTVATLNLAGESYTTQLTEDEYHFSLPGLVEIQNAQTRVGDAITRTVVKPVHRPELVQRGVTVTLPPYLGYSSKIVLGAKGNNLSVLRGSKLSLFAQTSRQLQTGEIQIQRVPTKIESLTPNASTYELTESSWESIESHIESDRLVSSDFLFLDNHKVQWNWRDVFGLSGSKTSEWFLQAVDDVAPSVQCTDLSDQLVLLENEMLKFRVGASDDFGIKHIGIEWHSQSFDAMNAQSIKGERLIATGGCEEKALQATATLSLSAEGIPPQTIELRAFVEDYLPNRGRIYSPSYRVRILSKEEHAQWVLRQMRRWKSKLEAVYDEENRLLKENQSLSGLTGADLDHRENRNALERQVNSELANAKKLDEVTKEGKRLLEQAIKNEEIRAHQVELWGRSLKRLEQLAQDAMPKLSDKISSAANAPKQSEEPGQTSNQKLPSANWNEKSPYDKEKDTGDRNSSENGAGQLTIPEVALGPSSQKGTSRQKKEQGKTPAQSRIDEVVQDHERIVEEFKNAKQAFEELMNDLENSSFVKRLKSAARFQRELAQSLASAIGSNFGKRPEKAKAAIEETELVVERQKLLADKLISIQQDMEAFQRNYPAANRESVLNEMKEKAMGVKLQEMPVRVKRNLRGDALNRSEYWADTFDRWAEELTDECGGGSCKGGAKDSLPPALVLEIMRIIRDEIDLREESRMLLQIKSKEEQVRGDWNERIAGQAIMQMAIQESTLLVLEDVRALPRADQMFKKEIDKLAKAAEFMDEASGVLAEEILNEDVIAAETAAIEALVQAKRPGKGGGNGGDSPGGGGTSESANMSLQDLLGEASDPNAQIAPRQVGEGTGATGRALPEKYKKGLDKFLNRDATNKN